MAKTFTWTGATDAVWETAGNWSVTGSGGASTYPGESIATDNVVLPAEITIAPPASAIIIANLTTASMAFVDVTETDWMNLTVNGTFTVPGEGTAGYAVLAIDFGPASTLVFTGADWGILNANGDVGPHTITAASHLLIIGGWQENGVNVTGATITTGGSCVIVGDSDHSGATAFINNINVTGPSTPGAAFVYTGSVVGTPASVSGFEPLFRVGDSGEVRSAFGSSEVLGLPPPGDVAQGTMYGDADAPITGTLPASTQRGSFPFTAGKPAFRSKGGPLAGGKRARS